MAVKQFAGWLAYIESLHPNTIELGLDRIQAVYENLALPKHKAKVITVAGTNGKGSCVQTLVSLFKNQGHKVGAYTSPHLFKFNERVKVNDKPLSDAKFVEAFTAVEAARHGVSLTYFEFTTLAAFYLLAHAKLDYWFLEVGMGGRLDAVNIIDPDFAVITTIAKDHMEYLGNTLSKIAKEKAGIMRQGKPVCLASKRMPSVLTTEANRLDAMLIEVDKSYQFAEDLNTWSWFSEDIHYRNIPKPNLPMESAAAALYVYHYFHDELLSPESLRQVFATLSMPGRFDSIDHGGTRVILDVAHNAEASQLLSNRLQQIKPERGKLTAIVAMLRDKEIENTLAPMTEVIDNWYVSSLDVPRSASSTRIGKYLADATGKMPHTFLSVARAFEEAYAESNFGDIIVVFGSFYTVAAVYACLDPKAYKGIEQDSKSEVQNLLIEQTWV